MTFRARPVGEGIYGVFVKRVSEVMNEPENSPIDLVRIEAKIFVEQLGKFNDEMKEECHNQTNEWLDLADTMGIRDSIELYITNKISDIFFELFQRSVDHAAEAIQGYQALGYKAILTQD